ncbi:hypothetical protein E3N88_41531 [Mikania micrantha]|uniref:GDSL esterase/lipase n=1 Tax=Mikania micrantha TaxID=192012 RepID=A0A5N6LKC9_9ASTR|nr:hypothetical protein E3N88_41531 [Mikania micrantha]
MHQTHTCVFCKSSTTVGLSTAGAGTTTAGTIGAGPSGLVFKTTRPIKVNIIGSANLDLEMTEEKALDLDSDYCFLKLNPPMESFASRFPWLKLGEDGATAAVIRGRSHDGAGESVMPGWIHDGGDARVGATAVMMKSNIKQAMAPTTKIRGTGDKEIHSKGGGEQVGREGGGRRLCLAEMRREEAILREAMARSGLGMRRGKRREQGNSQPLVPAMFIFGDSVVDVGNNNHLETVVKSNFPPYGRDFINHHATGRFCNGKLASDFTGENLGFTSYPPPILSKEANGKNLLLGANFASGGSGYYETTAKLYNTIPLSKQLGYYKEYQKKLVTIIGQSNATLIITGSIYLVSSGSSDFVQNYYVNPLLYKVYTPDQFSDILIKAYSRFIEELYRLGARKIGVSTLPPIGCLPASITLFGEDSNDCVTKMNSAAEYFNKMLNLTSLSLKSKLSGLNLVVLDIYHPLFDLIQKPGDYGMQ